VICTDLPGFPIYGGTSTLERKRKMLSTVLDY